MKTPATTWQDAPNGKGFPALAGEVESDVAIVGGGLAGLLTAYTLAKEGKSVVVLESSRIGGGTTGLTTAFLTQTIDTPLTDLARLLGKGAAAEIWNSGARAMDLLEDLVNAEGIDCEFQRCPAYLYGSRQNDVARLRKEAATARKLGFAADFLDRMPGLGSFGCVAIPDQAKFHPLKFLRGLARTVSRLGTRVFEGSEAVAIESDGVRTRAGFVRAGQVVVASHLPFNKPKALFLHKATYTTYVLEAELRSGVLPEAMYLDSANPYHYFRVDAFPGHDRLVLGGEDHRADLPVPARRNFSALERFLRTLPGGDEARIVRRWSGPIVESIDGLPFIGAYAPKRYCATAFSGSGMTFSAITAMLVRDLVVGRPNPWTALYDPLRKQSLRRLAYSGVHFSREFLGGALKNGLGL